MYVCICHNISEEDLEKTLQQSKNPSDALKKLKLGQSCGSCLMSALEKIQGKVQTKSQIFQTQKKHIS